MPLTSGDRLGPYEILASLGAGGMGEVYRARDTRLGRDVALKTLHDDLSQDPSRLQRFEQEARAIAALNYPNIVAVHDVGADRGVAYIITELIEGEPLRGARFALRKILSIAAQIANGLAAAHDAHVVHRDLKPENVLLTHDGRVKILAFGLAKMTAPELTGTAIAGETEQVRGQSADARSDIFNLGIILHEMLSGERPFHGETPGWRFTPARQCQLRSETVRQIR